MTKSEFLTLRANLLGGMDDYIHNVINNPQTTSMWSIEGVGVNDELTEDILLHIAEDDTEWNRLCYLFGNLVAGLGN